MTIVLLTIFSTCLLNLGYFLWKFCVKDLPRVGETHPIILVISFLTNRTWVLGMFLRLTGLACFIKATQIGDISLVQPLMSVGDVFLVLLSCFVLGEKLIAKEIFGLVITILGAVLIAIGAKSYLVTSLNWLHISLFLGLTITILIVFTTFFKSKRYAEIIYAVLAGTAFGISSILIKTMTTSLSLSGQEVNFVNCVLSPFIIFMEAFNITGLFLLQLAFQHGRAAVVVNLMSATSGNVAILAGILLFSETMTVTRILGIILIFTGTFIFKTVVKDDGI